MAADICVSVGKISSEQILMDFVSNVDNEPTNS